MCISAVPPGHTQSIQDRPYLCQRFFVTLKYRCVTRCRASGDFPKWSHESVFLSRTPTPTFPYTMPARPWTSKEQYAFLKSHIEGFRDAPDQRRSVLQVQAQFFAKWPEQLALWKPDGRPPDAEGFNDMVSSSIDNITVPDLFWCSRHFPIMRYPSRRGNCLKRPWRHGN